MIHDDDAHAFMHALERYLQARERMLNTCGPTYPPHEVYEATESLRAAKEDLHAALCSAGFHGVELPEPPEPEDD